MKRLPFIVLFLLSVCDGAWALTVGDPIGTEGILSLEYESINRNMKFDGGSRERDGETEPLLGNGESVGDFKLKYRRFLLKGILPVLQRGEVYFKIGLGFNNALFKYELKAPGGVQDVEFKGDYAFVYGGGLSAKAYERDGFFVRASLDYIAQKGRGTLKVDDVSFAEVYNVSYKSTNTISEWQLAVAAVRNFERFSPYGGLKYSRTSLENVLTYTDNDAAVEETFKAKSANGFGIFGGLDYRATQTMGFSAEFRLLDETAFTLGVHVKEW